MLLVQAFAVVFMLTWMNVSSSLKNDLYKPTADQLPASPPSPRYVGESFIVRNKGCTGSLIAPDWILSAAHCFQDFRYIGNPVKADGSNDVIISVDPDDDDDMIRIHKQPVNIRNKQVKKWTRPLSPPSKRNPESYWRKIDRVIIHEKFRSEALSWQGYDLALLHLSSDYGNEGNDSITEQAVTPVCLADKGFRDMDAATGPTYLAGFGRRRVPHCFTNEKGPETFEVCGRPIYCSHDHRTTKCGLQFLYKGQERNECLQSETPSASDPECIKLRESQPSLRGSDKSIHVFRNLAYLTTCYPEKPGPGDLGWCTTRPHNTDVNTEPTYNKGWGFCSDALIQDSCSTVIPEVPDTSDIPTTILSDEYCVEKLEANLVVEQPGVPKSTYDPLLPKSKVFCVGRNESRNFEDDLFYDDKGNGDYQIVTRTNHLIPQLITKGHIDKDLIDGGPSCFGDSGGPLWKMVDNPIKGGTPTPVLIGVFSFMLWGTCIGRNEPGYYGRVSDHIEWINRYVPKDEVCIYSNKFKDSKLRQF